MLLLMLAPAVLAQHGADKEHDNQDKHDENSNLLRF